MIDALWHVGGLDGLPHAVEGPLVWLVRLDDPEVLAWARGAALRPDDLRDLAGRPQAAMRGVRRQLTRVLLARLARCHPDSIVFARGAAGEPLVRAPEGWFVSVAGRWPHALIGLARQPLGVDIEPEIAPPPPEDALTPGESEELAEANDTTRVSRWAAKEAHAKALGIASRLEGSDIHTWQDVSVLQARSTGGETVIQLRHQDGLICALALLRTA